MKLPHSRALLSASRSLRSCREHHYRLSPVQSILSQRSYTTKSPQPSTSTSTSTSTTQPNNKDAHPTLSTQIRLLMRRVPYPVAIITSTDPSHTSASASSEPPTSHFRGMTVSSFNTVTLTPQPVISFNVRQPSETLNALLSSRRFLVHLLATTPETASLARDFARGNQNLALGEGQFEFVGIEPSTQTQTQTQAVDTDTDTGDNVPRKLPPLPLPMLRRRGRNGHGQEASLSSGKESSCFPFVFECRLLPESVSQVYDHTIVVGTIVRAITSSENPEGSAEDLCLTYANTKFWEVGKEVV